MKQRFFSRRAAGILLPVFSLPSPYGIGSFGDAAYRWIDFLAEAGQSYWQVLPVGPTSYGDSPYQSFSAFAGNPYFIDLDLLCREGLLRPEQCRALPWGTSQGKVDYRALFDHREALLQAAHRNFQDRGALAAFLEENREWLEDYALYMAVKSKMGLRPWWEWEEDIRLRRPDAVARWRKALGEEMDYQVFVQYLFFRQWGALKEYAGQRGIGVIGDIPIYVAMDSADVWAGSDLFLLDQDKRPIDVAGVPPDGFSADGQLWGNPLYRWDAMKEDGYRWWMKRLRFNLTLYDVLRIDHFRGFESYYAVPAHSETALTGEWRQGPGMDFVSAVHRELGPDAAIIAEDLGFLTDGVRELLQSSGYPGMKVLQFAFDSREESDYMPHNYRPHCVAYTGTHDNDTVRGWLTSAPKEDILLALEYMGTDQKGGTRAFLRAALSSVAMLAVIPIQDYLDLGGEARVNIPATLGGENWRWRMLPSHLSPALAEEIARMTALYGRLPPKPQL